MTQDLNPNKLYRLVREDTYDRDNQRRVIIAYGTKEEMLAAADILNGSAYKPSFDLFKVIKV